MDSLKNMLSSWSNVPLRQEVENRIKLIFADPLMQQFRSQHPEIDDKVIHANQNKMYQYLNEQKNCSNCPGLELCPNDLVGHYTVLQTESHNEQWYVYDKKKSCRKFNAQMNQEAIHKRIHSLYVDPYVFQELYSFEDILNRDLQRAPAVNQITKYIEKTIDEGLQTTGLYLVGPLGTGKTFLMCYMLYQLAKVGLTGAIVYMPDFAEDLKSLFHDSQKMKDMIDLMKETELLVFDDIGSENLNPWMRDHVIGAILNARMNRKPTFFTSNYELSSLEKHFSFTSKEGDDEFKGKRLMDRIRPFVETVVVEGTNQRGIK
jgi:primosomal protein DnaI